MRTLAPSCYIKECGTWLVSRLTGEGSTLKQMENEAKGANVLFYWLRLTWVDLVK